MDKHKQFTETVHPVGALINPAPALATAVAGGSPGRFNFSEADLSSDFTSNIDPNGPPPPAVSNEVVAAPPLKEDKPPIKAGGNIGGGPKLPPNLQKLLTKRNLIIFGAVILLLVVGAVAFAIYKLTPKAQMINDSSKLDSSTLFIDSDKKTVGIKSPTNPDGLQVGATVTANPQNASNIRLGLINGTDPSILFEDGQKNSWQVLGVGGSFQFIQGTQVRVKLDDKALSLTNALNVGSDANIAGNTTLGSAATSLVTIQANSISIPNNLSISGNTLFIDASRGTIAVGAASSGGFKMLVAGTLKVNSSFTVDGQVLGAAGSAKAPSFTFNGNTNTGIYKVSTNVLGVTAAGSQVLQIQLGSVLTVNGANFEADGYLRAGRGANSPFFQLARFTGTLDGAGVALVTDGLSTGYARVLLVQAFYKGNSSEAIPMNVDFVNSGNFQISGGIPGRAYRATLFYSQDNAGW